MVDDERAAKNVDLRKKKPDYNPYQEETVDEFGNVSIYYGETCSEMTTYMRATAQCSVDACDHYQIFIPRTYFCIWLISDWCFNAF